MSILNLETMKEMEKEIYISMLRPVEEMSQEEIENDIHDMYDSVRDVEELFVRVDELNETGIIRVTTLDKIVVGKMMTSETLSTFIALTSLLNMFERTELVNHVSLKLVKVIRLLELIASHNIIGKMPVKQIMGLS